MSRSKHSEAQIIAALKQVEAGRTADDVALECGVSKHTIYTWKAKFVDDAQPAPEAPNTFYNSALNLFRLATVLLSLSMELGAGLALRDAWTRVPHSSED